jgi:metal-responsive CopG/Arc/MetJ family transcriptional regulator
LALQAIMSRRRKRGGANYSRSEVISDALWHYLTEVEKVPRSQIDAMMPELPENKKQSNVKPFQKKKD